MTVPALDHNTMPMLVTRVKRDTKQRVADAAARADQPISAWLRMAIMEKLDRDEAR